MLIGLVCHTSVAIKRLDPVDSQCNLAFNVEIDGKGRSLPQFSSSILTAVVMIYPAEIFTVLQILLGYLSLWKEDRYCTL